MRKRHDVVETMLNMAFPPQKGHLMMADNIQYTTVCPLCRAQLPLSQKQVETGRAPICDGCGGTMIVHGLTLAAGKVRGSTQILTVNLASVGRSQN
jgi:hypothetical protein